MKSIGIIGNGFVGSAIVNAFKNNFNIKINDKDLSRSNSTLEETLESDVVFVCVPTPMKNASGTECNLSILKSVLDEINIKNKNKNIIVIKSTVPPGTTQELQEKYPSLNLLHSPEFLTAKNAKQDFIDASRHIFGIPHYGNNKGNFDLIIEIFKTHFPKSKIISMSSNESELVKYICNCFLATKVSFFNEMRLLCDKLNLNWKTIMSGVLTDERIGISHTNVPGHDGYRGFGGTCFPKDINALIHFMVYNQIDPMVLKAAWEQNKNVREVWDWASEKSAVNDTSWSN